jgi:hypothetical protein
MTTQRDSVRTAGVTAMRALAFSLLATGVIVLSTPAAAQICKETIDAINSAKTARADHESEQKLLLERIGKIEEGERAFRQQLQAGDCRPEGTAATDDKRPSCKVLLDAILTANKMRDSLKQQIDTLKRMAADAASDEQKLVQSAKAGGCPPYGEPQKKATAPVKKPKKATRKRRRPRTTVRRPRRQPRRPPPRGGVTIQLGPGGIGMGF